MKIISEEIPPLNFDWDANKKDFLTTDGLTLEMLESEIIKNSENVERTCGNLPTTQQ